MEIRYLVSFIGRWFWLLAAFMLVTSAATFFVFNSMPKEYEGSTTLLVNQTQSPGVVGYSEVMASQQLTKTYSEMIKKRPVLERAISIAGVRISLEDLVKELNVQPVRDTTLIAIRVQNNDPKAAATLANAIAAAFVEENRKIQLGQTAESREAVSEQIDLLAGEIRRTSDQVDQLRASDTGLASEAKAADLLRLQSALAQYQLTYSQLLKSEQEMRLVEGRAYSGVAVIEPALVPSIPVGPKTVQYTLIAAALGLGIAALLGIAVEYLGDKSRVYDDAVRKRVRGIGLDPLAAAKFRTSASDVLDSRGT